MNKFVLKLTARGMGSVVEMDGEPVGSVRAVTVRAGVGERTTVTLEISASVSVTADAELVLIAQKASEE